MKRALWFGLSFLCACSSGKREVPIAPETPPDDDSGVVARSGNGGRGGNGVKGGSGSTNGGAGSTMDAGLDGATADELAPSISIITPMPADDPSSEHVLVAPSVRVRCKVERSSAPGSSPVDQSSIKITLQDMRDATKSTSAPVSAVSNEEFEAMFDLSNLANGALTFRCTAKDTSTHMGTASLTTLLDLGPSIKLDQPKDKAIYALKSPFKIMFTVQPSPVADSDDNAEVKSVTLTIGGVETPVTESTDKPGEYQTTIDFTDKTKFPVAPTTAQIQVFASDARMPTAATRRVQADVTIDGDGPKVTVQSPGNFTIQHGSVPLVVEVTDPSGIMPGTLIATINTKPYMSWKGAGPVYTQTFDTRDIDQKNELTQLTINLTAIDNVGNKTDPPVSHSIRLDNLPPVISLDPPHIAESRISNNMRFCSQWFDPVGSRAVSDLQQGFVLASAYFRALVEDKTNHSPGSVFDYLSGTNPTRIDMYTQGLVEVPLLIDTNGDHICDEIYNNENDTTHDKLPDDKLPVKIKLAPVDHAGVSWFARPSTPGTIDDPLCHSDPGGSDSPPNTICPNSEMSRAVPGRIQGKPPAVYAFQPSNSPSSGECTGAAWEIKGNTRGREGWICAAGRAEDNIGNVGVSAPLRFCFDDSDSSNGTPDCGGAPPSCTDGCTISDAQKFAPVVWPVPP